MKKQLSSLGKWEIIVGIFLILISIPIGILIFKYEFSKLDPNYYTSLFPITVLVIGLSLLSKNILNARTGRILFGLFIILLGISTILILNLGLIHSIIPGVISVAGLILVIQAIFNIKYK